MQNKFGKAALSAIMSLVLALGLMPAAAFANIQSFDPAARGDSSSNVIAISFTPVEPYTLAKNTRGDDWNLTDEDNTIIETYWYYQVVDIAGRLYNGLPTVDSDCFRYGDALTVTYSDDTSKTYTYTEGRGRNDDDEFKAEDGTTIDEDDIVFSEDQKTTYWTLGSNNFLTVEYKGATCQVPVTITYNSIESISFEAVPAYTLTEATGGAWVDEGTVNEWYQYEVPDYQDGDKLSVKEEGETAVTYTYSSGAEAFVSGAGVTISPNSITRYTDQSAQNPWTVGGNNKLHLLFKGQTCDVPVTIVANPIKSISYTPVTPWQIIQEDRDFGYWDSEAEDEDEDAGDDDDDGDDEDVFIYNPVGFADGDKLTVTDSSNVSVEYTAAWSDEASGYVFAAANGDAISASALELTSDQDEEPWETPGDYNFTVTYSGRSCDIPVTIAEKLDVSKATVTLSQSSFTYSGVACAPTAIVQLGGETLSLGKQYYVSYENNIDAGEATVVVEGTGKCQGTARQTFTIAPASLASASVSLATTAYTYTGSAIMPAPTVQLGSKTLVAGTDYTALFSGNTNAGTATVAAMGRGNYTGIASSKFTIAKAANTLAVKAVKATQTVKKGKKATIKAVKAFKVTKNVSKGAMSYKLTSVPKKAKKYVSVASNGKITVKKGLAKGTYNLKVSATSKATANYNQASKPVSFKLKVK